MTIVGAGLIGAGVAIFGVVLVAVGRRVAAARVRRREPRPRPVPSPRPAPARPGPGHPRSGPVAPPRARAAEELVPRRGPQAGSRGGGPRRSGVPTGGRSAGGAEVMLQALEGETLQLGPVPAWKLPVRPSGSLFGRNGVGSLFGRTRGGDASTGGTGFADTVSDSPRVRPAMTDAAGIEDQPVVGNASRRHDGRMEVGPLAERTSRQFGWFARNRVPPGR